MTRANGASFTLFSDLHDLPWPYHDLKWTGACWLTPDGVRRVRKVVQKFDPPANADQDCPAAVRMSKNDFMMKDEFSWANGI